MRYYNEILGILIIGFCFTIIITSILLIFNKSKRQNIVIQEFAYCSIDVIRIVGIVNLMITIILFLSGKIGYNVTISFHWWHYHLIRLLMLFGFTLLPLLFWIKYLKKDPFRFIIAVGLLFSTGIFIEEFTIAFSSFFRDYSSDNLILNFLLKISYRILVFITIVFIVISFKKRLRNTQKK